MTERGPHPQPVEGDEMGERSKEGRQDRQRQNAVRHSDIGEFFFSSRRRHTRCLNDWSSDVCSSDLWELMAQAGRFTEAATDLTEIINADESQDWKLYLLTPLLIQSGRLADYTNHCKSMLEQFEKTTNPSIAERTAKSCLLLPAAVTTNDLARAANLAARAVSLSDKGAWVHWRL